MPHAEWLPESTPPVLQEIINKKDEKIENYTKKVREHWLLVIADTGGLSSTVKFDKGIHAATYESKFNRIFLFSLFGPKTYELKIA